MRLYQVAFLSYLMIGLVCPLLHTIPAQAESTDNSIIDYWTLQAEKGDKFSQNKLADKFMRGDGVAQDFEKAAYWYQKAAKQDVKKAQHILGTLLEEGKGVEQNLRQAFYWYQQSAKNGYYLGYAELGRMYEHGKSVRRDLDKAMEFYRHSIELQPGGPYWIKQAMRQLENKQQCVSSARTTLFSNEILCASRDDFRQAIAKAGGVPIRENDQFWYDKYKSHKILSNTSELQMGYTREGEFAQAQYIFPSSEDPQQVNRIKWMVQNRYGLPQHSSGSPRSGKVKYVWKLEDGVEIKVMRGWPDTTTYLSYSNPEAFEKMFSEIKNTQE